MQFQTSYRHTSAMVDAFNNAHMYAEGPGPVRAGNAPNEEDPSAPIRLVHVDGAPSVHGVSMNNFSEAHRLRALIHELPKGSERPMVLTPYAAQSAVLIQVPSQLITRKQSHSIQAVGGVADVYTVGKAQGQERDNVFISLVQPVRRVRPGTHVAWRPRNVVAFTRARYPYSYLEHVDMIHAASKRWCWPTSP